MIEVSREDLVLMMESGFIYLRLGKFAEALDVFEGVLALSPESEVPVVAIGSVYFGQMKYDQAITHYKKALKKKSDSAFARAYLGESLFFIGKKEEALSELEKASMLEPQGKSGDFARVLMDAIKNGYTPPGMMVSA
ncbi:MAG: tetratricopeptide repeat protein [Deltaproteobacteria bacterium]|nr:MAG: tetratricopeptide repeat protein [Deltaproteobacteria bacterium]